MRLTGLLRRLDRDPLSKSAFILPGDDFFTRMQGWLAARSTGTLGKRARENADALAQLEPMQWTDRVQHIQVMCAGNTIMMVLLFLIVTLQVSLSLSFLSQRRRPFFLPFS